MYLKNTSTRASVVINTARGKVGIKPGEVVDIKYKILPPVSQSLIQVNEEEYLSFCQKTTGNITTSDKSEKENIEQPAIVVKEERLDDLERIEDEIDEVVEIKDHGVMDFVNNLLKNPDENEALVVNETDSEKMASDLTQQIADLKESWQASRSPRKKEALIKEIKELQKQLKKIQK